MVLVALLFAVALPAVAQMEMPKPAPELKKLDYFVGTWTTEGDIKPSSMGAGGKWTGSEHYEWMEGGFFLTGHAEYSGPEGKAKGPAFLGYDSNDKMFTYDSFNSMGEAEHSKGNVNGDTWTYTSDEKMGGQSFKARYSMKILSPTSYTMKFEMSQDGTNWMTVMEGKATKK
jgi:hypothetical protein